MPSRLITILVAALALLAPPMPVGAQPAPPPPPPPPTIAPYRWYAGRGAQAVMRLPGTIYQVSMAVHPHAHWPALGAMQRHNLSAEGIHYYVTVFNPTVGAWMPAVQVDTADAPGSRGPFGTIAVAITGDDAVHAVYGAAGDGQAGLYHRVSRDYGQTWSRPERIATSCWDVSDLAATVDGQLVALGHCFTRVGGLSPTPQTTMITRRADGTWLAPQPTGVPGWFGSVAVAGDGPDALATAWVTAKGGGQDQQMIYLIHKYLRNEQLGWQVLTRRIAPPGVAPGEAGASHWRPQNLTFTRFHADGTTSTGIIFTWSGQYRASGYALVSLDGGLSWSDARTVHYAPGDDRVTGRRSAFLAPAYDPAADSLVALWPCCGDGRRGSASTHYAAWADVTGARWTRLPDPLLTTARSATAPVTAQAPGTRWVWLAWIEDQQTIIARSVDLDRIVPLTRYRGPFE
jgi:hypothetical protein